MIKQLNTHWIKNLNKLFKWDIIQIPGLSTVNQSGNCEEGK